MCHYQYKRHGSNQQAKSIARNSCPLLILLIISKPLNTAKKSQNKPNRLYLAKLWFLGLMMVLNNSRKRYLFVFVPDVNFSVSLAAGTFCCLRFVVLTTNPYYGLHILYSLYIGSIKNKCKIFK